MATLYVLGRSGDKRVEWDHDQARSSDPVAIAAIAEAEQIFALERSRGSSAFKLVPGQPAERVDAFDPSVEETVIVPRMTGG
jgi:hypothetical protein